MSMEAVLCAAVTPIVPVCCLNEYSPGINEEPEAEYCTFTFSEYPEHFGDGSPEFSRYFVMLHYFLPLGVNPRAKKRCLRNALIAADFTAPEITNASDDDYQHYVFECEYLGAFEEG